MQEEEEEMTTDEDREGEGNEKKDEGAGCIDMGK